MVEKLVDKEERAELRKEVAELVEKHLTVTTKERRIWLVSKEMKAAIMGDTLEFYDKLKPLTHYKDYRMLLALQFSLDNNKCAVNMIKSEGGHMQDAKVRIRDIEIGRDMTNVKKIDKPAEYVDSHVSFLIRTGLLNEEEGKKIAKIANDTLFEYDNKKSKPIGTPIDVSAAAVYYAAYKGGKPLSIMDLEYIFNVSRQTLSPRSNELVEIAISKDEALWFEHMKRRGLRDRYNKEST
jgi:hypothetical protein